jgi:OOP family OmpA-OmpF porin
MNRISAVVFASAATLATTAVATAAQGDWYVRGEGGYVFGGDTFDGDIPTFGDHAASTDGGWRASVAAGYLVESDLRIEIEVGYSDRDTSDGRLFGAPLAQVSGSINALMVSANLVWDIPHQMFGLQPFVGGGVGMLRVDADYTSLNAGTITINDADTEAMGKLFAGVAYPIGDRLDATFTYQYAGALNDIDFPAGPALAPPQGVFHTGYDEHSLSLGIRFTM